jgi:2-methylisocitrate lyase-like PEP mutase family enzyme
MGYRIVIFPNSLARLFTCAGLQLLETLHTEGTTRPWLNQMLDFAQINDLFDIEHFRQLERSFLPAPDSPINPQTNRPPH